MHRFLLSTRRTIFELILFNQICIFRLKFGWQTNLKMQKCNQILTIYVLDQKFGFLENLFQKMKIVTLSWSFAFIIMRISRIQWGCKLFFVLVQKYRFWANSLQKIKNCDLKQNFGTQTYLNAHISDAQFLMFQKRNTVF